MNKRYRIIISFLIFIILTGLFLFLKSFTETHKPNVILITLDALRPDHLGCYGYERNTSPNIDKLAWEGVIFTEAISQSSHTAASVTSLMTSTYPNIHNVKDWGYPFNPPMHLYTLPEILSSHGYKTALISEQIGLSLIKGLEKGFVTYNTIWTHTFGTHSKKIINITDWAIDWLKNNKNKKFFLWLYYLDPHGPYKPPPPYNKIFLNDGHNNVKQSLPISDDIHMQTVFGKIPKYLATDNITEVDYYISQYDAEIKYVDSQIGRLYEELKKLRLDKNTIIIITSDHGEGMGEHNLYFGHGVLLYDELIKIALIIKLNKNIQHGKRVDIQVRSIDILPTILDILGIKTYRTLQGSSLLPLIMNKKTNLPFYAYSEHLSRKAVRTKEWKLIYNENNGQYELYNLKDDPGELNNLVSVEKEQFELLRQKLEDYIKQARPKTEKSKLILNEETKERLRSLGYVQ